ncbi:hypothetical protein MLD38_023536 [Melastoma candidum]|uniref:Uncharacterized protein n=1 Tax=Melastoma candidum TaxID=119954 RepID=A0ACB9NR35_9MYRT|nr:hypothetical protein MLD38_023536 [Melastoma candidum]
MVTVIEQPRTDAPLVDTWDYKGSPADRSSTGGWSSAAMILCGETCERLTTLGIAVNLVTYLTGTMHLGNASPANVVTNFHGTSFMLCVLGGFVADAFIGRPACRPTAGVLYLALYTLALGTGGLKSIVSGFGSDQFDESDPGERAQMVKFFSWFFFFISIGSLVVVTVLVYIQDNLGRDWGYGICAILIGLGLAVFLSGTRRYRFKRLAGSPLMQIAAVFCCMLRKRNLQLPSDPSELFDVDHLKMKQKLPQSKQCCFLDEAAIKETTGSTSNGYCLNKWSISTLTDVEEVKMVLRMLPVWATNIMFRTVYAQMTTFSVLQASTMDRRLGSFRIPSASLTVFFVGSILLTVPVYDRIIVPLARRLLHNPQGLTPLQRIGVGLVLSVFTVVAAALTEIKRLRSAHRLANPKDPIPLSMFWLIPQFLLVGSGEAFMYIGQLDFFLRECPKGMKTMSMGLFLSTLSLGLFVSSLLVTVVHKVTGNRKPWLADNLNQGRLYNFYWLLASLNSVNLAVFLKCARGYVYKDKRLALEGIVGEEEDELTMHA